ncbi:hypothetical protein BH11BAC5_BH11BAC5_00040 [soil metagenome]
MQKPILFFTVVLILTSCGQTSINKKQDLNKDAASVTDEEVTPDIKKLRQDYILSYNKPIEFESLNKSKNGEHVKVWGKYYCLFDKGINVPGKYNFDDTTKSFPTHNFAEDIAIISNGDTVLKKTITKNNFIGSLPQYLKDYAVIFEPKFEGYDSDNDTFDFSFSISIPLTDVGQLMSLSLKRNGLVSVKEAK